MLTSPWTTGPQAWAVFISRHPELGYRPGHWAFHNFLRASRSQLLAADAIRLAKRRHWIAHVDRFCSVAFECCTSFQGAAALKEAQQ
jgi:hypothetical protein